MVESTRITFPISNNIFIRENMKLQNKALKYFFFQIEITVLETHAMEEVNVKVVPMTIHVNARMDMMAKTAK